MQLDSVKSLRILIEEIDHEDRVRPIHLDMQVVRAERLQNLQLRGMLLKAVEKFADPAKQGVD